SVADLDLAAFPTRRSSDLDEVLVAIGRRLRAQFAAEGVAARFGGEEFVLLLPDADAARAQLQCEFLRQSIALLPAGLPVTVSIGIAEFRRRDDTVQDVFRRADEALYAA